MSVSNAEGWSAEPRGKASKPLLDLLLEIDSDTQCERRFEWLFLPMTHERLHLEHDVLRALRKHCRDTRRRHPAKATCDPDTLLRDDVIGGRARALEFDFFLPTLGTALEFDERQHFTEERRVSLECYGDLEVGFDKKRWAELCSPTVQDPDPPCRDWVRAFRDAVRDIRAAQRGLRLVRLYYRDFDEARCGTVGAIDQLREILTADTSH